jgi:DNA-binding NtrC family response regulator
MNLKTELAELKTQVIQRYRIERIIGKTPQMQELFKTIETIGPSDVSVLITGESGTGKELVAEALHRQSPRASKSIIKLSCAALPENLLESELFGHERGAFTDAKEKKLGRFELADGGSIFLDDIDDMNLPTQVKLLRVLQEREFERIGGTKTIKVNVRLITATKTDLSLLVRQGRFRDDLYFRLRVIELRLPSLRERIADIPLLVQHFIRVHGGTRRYNITPETVQHMCGYQWPGNIRELENAVLRAIAMAGASDNLDERHLMQMPGGMRTDAANFSVPVVGGTMLGPQSSGVALNAPVARAAAEVASPSPVVSAPPSRTPSISEPEPAAVLISPSVLRPSEFEVTPAEANEESASAGEAPATESTVRALRDVVADAERAYIKEVLTITNNNKTRAAQLLDISRKNLWEKMRDLGLL